MSTIDSLLEIMKSLRDPDSGCPWDLEQNFASIAPYTLEEAYEVVDAIERNDHEQLCGELGDLLFQVVFHSQMAAEENLFDFHDVIQAISTKMRRRHPHVFADDQASTPDQVIQNWHKIKQSERGTGGSALDGIPVSLPALKKAQKMGSSAAALGFDWPDWHGARDKLQEEIGEFEAAVKHNPNGLNGASDAIEQELGDVLFSVVNLCRHFNVDAESALNRTSRKFARRFKHVEAGIQDCEQSGATPDLDFLEQRWQEAKNKE